jgi:hypothetical protein
VCSAFNIPSMPLSGAAEKVGIVGPLAEVRSQYIQDTK